jgi:hypothetical protein
MFATTHGTHGTHASARQGISEICMAVSHQDLRLFCTTLTRHWQGALFGAKYLQQKEAKQNEAPS